MEDEDGSATQLSSLFGQALLMCPCVTSYLRSPSNRSSNLHLSEFNSCKHIYPPLITPLTGIPETQPATVKAHHTNRCNDVVEIRLRTAPVSGRHLRESTD